MRAVVYSETGAPDVLRLVERPVPEPGPGEARVAVAVSGVNPTDWKARRSGPLPSPEVVPNQDGAGTIEAVGDGVDASLVGERVWVWEARGGGPTERLRSASSSQSVRPYGWPTGCRSTLARASASRR
jgi:NADPH:quinone reductase-like Zn-dependent oxidoreductase